MRLSTLTLLLKSVMTLTFLISSQAFADSFKYDLDFRATSEVTSTSGADIYTPEAQADGEVVLKPIYKLEKGHAFSFRPSVTFEGSFYLNDEGTRRGLRGRYFGSILISEEGRSQEERQLIRNLNSKKIYIYEWKIDKKDYIKKAFDEEPKYPSAIPQGASFRWDEVNPKQAWTSYAADFIQSNKDIFHDDTITDINEFCPGFADKDEDEKTAFWIHLLNSLSKKESAFDPLVSNDESNFGGGDLDVVSRGLLQTSKKSSRAYRSEGCRVRDDRDLHNPETSLTCGLAIFKKWLKTDRCISCKNDQGKHRGIARYWSPLRARYQVSCSICSGGVANIGFRKVIIAETSQTPACQPL